MLYLIVDNVNLYCMFGLKLVKSQDYTDLNWRLEQALKLIDEKDAKIAKQSGYISELEDKIKDLENERTAVKKDSKKVVLLTDVAEEPLKEDKPKKVIKKKESTTTRKRIRKNEE